MDISELLVRAEISSQESLEEGVSNPTKTLNDIIGGEFEKEFNEQEKQHTKLQDKIKSNKLTQDYEEMALQLNTLYGNDSFARLNHNDKNKSFLQIEW